MSVALPFSVNVTLALPPDAGQDSEPIEYAFSGTFIALASSIYNLTGSGTAVIDFSNLPAVGAKLLLVKVDAGAAVQPVGVKINASLTAEEVSAGGGKLLVSPAPSTGITGMTLVYSSDATVRVWALG